MIERPAAHNSQLLRSAAGCPPDFLHPLQATRWISCTHCRQPLEYVQFQDTSRVSTLLAFLRLLQHYCQCYCTIVLQVQRSVSNAAAMARTGMVVIFLVLAMLAMGETAPSPPNCDSAASALLPCYPYVTGPDAKPPADCCGGLGSLNTNSPTCLCQLITQLNGSAASDPTVNITKAFNLPKDCAITLKTSDCPALANLPLAPPAGVSPAVPTTATPGPTAAGPGSGVQPGNDVSKLLPTSLMIGMAVAAGVVVQALVF